MKNVPIWVSLLIVILIGYFVYSKKPTVELSSKTTEENIENFTRQKRCIRPPQFLAQMGIGQPVMIDLSQKRFKGIAFLYGKNMQEVLHPKIWEQYEHFSTYTLDSQGNAYLAPMPFISVKQTTFNLQKNLYKLDTKTGKIEVWIHFDDVQPSTSNPYGINSVTYDCDDNSLWVSAIDETSYEKQKGIIYHIDIETKKILQKIEGLDALSMYIVKSKQNKYLLVGSARDNALYVYSFNKNKLNLKPKKLLTLPSPNEHIRKIKVKGDNHLELQTIPFSYTLITQTAKWDRALYDVFWNDSKKIWTINKKR